MTAAAQVTGIGTFGGGHCRQLDVLQQLQRRNTSLKPGKSSRSNSAKRLPRNDSWATAIGDAMSIVTWLVIGLISGFIASKLMNRGGSILGDIVVGVIGAVVGGFLFNLFGAKGVTGLNLWSVLVAVAGSVALLVAFHAMRRRSGSMS
jgi:uncharacterized membrane protein YeaQ/YmgE (transglycosylase-associated protein family)